MALKKYEVQEGYAFFHLNNVGMRTKRVHAGGIVELPDINHHNQSWKLKECAENAPAPPNDLEMIEGVKGNAKLLELFEDGEITTFRAVAELATEELETCLKGNKAEKAEKAKAIIASAFELAGG